MSFLCYVLLDILRMSRVSHGIIIGLATVSGDHHVSNGYASGLLRAVTPFSTSVFKLGDIRLAYIILGAERTSVTPRVTFGRLSSVRDFW